MRVSLRNKKGMTLVEAVVSVALIAVVVVSLVAVLTQSSVFSRTVDTAFTASYLAQRRIDVLNRFGFDQLPLAEETDIRIDSDGNIAAEGNYLRTTEVDTDFDDNIYLTKVKVSVKRVKINIDGTIKDPETGEMTFVGQPIVMETLFADFE